MFDFNKFRNGIREYRQAANLTLEEFSELADIDRNTLSNVENDISKPTITTIVHLLNAMNTNIEDFMGNRSDMKALLRSNIIEVIKTLDDEKQSIFYGIVSIKRGSYEF